MKTPMIRSALLAGIAASLIGAAPYQSGKVTPEMVQTGSDIPADWQAPKTGFDYTKTDVMIPMRDGVKLHTVIMVPKGAKDLPILLERTPYNASGFAPNNSPKMKDAVWSGDTDWADGTHILVWQDIRGKYGSEGDYVMVRPPRGPLNPGTTDDTTDAWDTIDWLVKNVQGTNGRVGMIGSSYDGWTVAMALLDPHPALKVAAPESPMVDGWMGDDWFHYGAFRTSNLDYFTGQMTEAGSGPAMPRDTRDEYDFWLQGSVGDIAKANGVDKLPFWQRLSANPAYNAFWQLQAVDRMVAAKPSNVPTMWLQGFWDQEDIYGAVHSWEAMEKAGYGATNHLVIGPWWHSQINRSAWNLGPLKWNGDTAADFRQQVMIPFFDQYLKDGAPAHPLPSAMIYNPAENHWDSFADWKVNADRTMTPLYLQADKGLGFETPGGQGEDSYVSDPAKPVPYIQRPIVAGDEDRWRTWLVQDQRFVADRSDVVSYTTPVLTKTVTIHGAPVADIFAKTTGTDGDFVVKLIDVYPATYPENPEMGGYQLPIAMDIFRGRYRDSLSDPSPIPAGKVQEYKFRLPTVNYEVKPGHRIMVQIQSSLFPVYDRNPQKYVKNIFFAKPGDYQKATVSIEHGGMAKSAVLLPLAQ
ncbi:CocE/NonD family hydrolase [Stakelama pacifica]|uniref:Xaa-Pro dipeptidyl-peptidase C-terminal domain-containing protein n=1 Tax=Stakelama pacifica TaxID=517720 RepID=A0A4R6FDG4_9SPHN|nr:hypothetical protein EV664_11344 [Stakelama pacifica]GGO98568.1 glutaryl-7-ACA acylase [Stakelama pacifica]